MRIMINRPMDTARRPLALAALGGLLGGAVAVPQGRTWGRAT
jgi:hypothetical protein